MYQALASACIVGDGSRSSGAFRGGVSSFAGDDDDDDDDDGDDGGGGGGDYDYGYGGGGGGGGGGGEGVMRAAAVRKHVQATLGGGGCAPILLHMASSAPASSAYGKYSFGRAAASRQQTASSSSAAPAPAQTPTPRFVPSREVFVFLPYDVSPHAFHTRQCCSFFGGAFLTSAAPGTTELAEALGVRFEPTPDETAGWIRAIAADADAGAAGGGSGGGSGGGGGGGSGGGGEGGGGVLSAAQLGVAVNAILTLGALVPSPTRAQALAQCLAPTAAGRLVPAASLIAPDAPWLDGRLDTRLLNLVHPRLALATDSFALGSGGGVTRLPPDGGSSSTNGSSSGGSGGGGGGGGGGSGSTQSIVGLLGVRKVSGIPRH